MCTYLYIKLITCSHILSDHPQREVFYRFFSGHARAVMKQAVNKECLMKCIHVSRRIFDSHTVRGLAQQTSRVSAHQWYFGKRIFLLENYAFL